MKRRKSLTVKLVAVAMVFSLVFAGTVPETLLAAESGTEEATEYMDMDVSVDEEDGVVSEENAPDLEEATEESVEDKTTDEDEEENKGAETASDEEVQIEEPVLEEEVEEADDGFAEGLRDPVEEELVESDLGSLSDGADLLASEDVELSEEETLEMYEDDPDLLFATADEAISWVQSVVGQTFGDGECVYLARAYYSHLGATPAYGNGYDYKTNPLPEGMGWQRLEGVHPEKGDILVFTGGGWGHVAIYESDYVTYHQNWNKHKYVERVDNIYYTGVGTDYWGFIRPNFEQAGPTPVNVGDNFYAFIKHSKTWQGLVAKDYNVCVEKAENKPEHRWHFERLSDGSYKITSVKDGKCMEVENFGTANGTNVALNDNYNGNTAQRWYIYGESGSYRFAGVCGKNVMDLAGGANVDGTNIQMWEDYGGENQLFQIWKIELPNFTTTDAWAIGSNYSEKDNVEIAWNKCNDADGYDIRIYKEDGSTLVYPNPFYVKNTSFKATLSKGIYQVEVAALNSSFGNWKIGPKCKIIVDGLEKRDAKLSKIKDDSGNNVLVSWDKCDGATSYDIRVFSEDGNTQKEFYYVPSSTLSFSLKLPIGIHQINVTPCNNEFSSWRYGDKSKIEITANDVVENTKNDDNENESVNNSDDETGYNNQDRDDNDDEEIDPDDEEDADDEDEDVDVDEDEEGEDDESEDSDLIDISELEFGKIKNYAYTGGEIKPAIIIKDAGSRLVKDIDYKLSYRNNRNAGKASIIIEGINDYTGMVTKSFTINKAKQTINPKLAADTIVQGKSTTISPGKAIGKITYTASSPIVSVSAKGKVQAKGVGAAKIVVTATGDKNHAMASKTLSLVINPAGVAITKIKNPSKGQVNVVWGKNATATGYELQYSTSANFKTSPKKKTISGSKTTGTTIKKLSRGKWHFRIRTFKTVGGRKYYSAWSKGKSIKVQK